MVYRSPSPSQVRRVVGKGWVMLYGTRGSTIYKRCRIAILQVVREPKRVARR